MFATPTFPLPTVPGPQVFYQASAPRQRTAIACQYCRRRKIRCSGIEDSAAGRCTNCVRFNQHCLFTPVSSQKVPVRAASQGFVPSDRCTAATESISPNSINSSSTPSPPSSGGGGVILGKQHRSSSANPSKTLPPLKPSNTHHQGAKDFRVASHRHLSLMRRSLPEMEDRRSPVSSRSSPPPPPPLPQSAYSGTSYHHPYPYPHPHPQPTSASSSSTTSAAATPPYTAQLRSSFGSLPHSPRSRSRSIESNTACSTSSTSTSHFRLPPAPPSIIAAPVPQSPPVYSSNHSVAIAPPQPPPTSSASTSIPASSSSSSSSSSISSTTTTTAAAASRLFVPSPFSPPSSTRTSSTTTTPHLQASVSSSDLYTDARSFSAPKMDMAIPGLSDFVAQRQSSTDDDMLRQLSCKV